MVEGINRTIADELSVKYKDTLSSVTDDKQKYISQMNHGKGEDVLLFFSFDIVNSSFYKSYNYYGWFAVIDGILTDIRLKVRKQIGLDTEVWRILGDEVVFIKKIQNRDSIIDYINSIYLVLIDTCRCIENGNLQKKLEIEKWYIDYTSLQNIVSIQACAWIAPVVEKNSISSGLTNVGNVFEIIDDSKNVKFYEFTGIDIDAGFRLSKKTRARRLVLSFELAYLLSKDENVNKKLHIITYCPLKGIWNDAVYPIVWYYDSSLNNGESFKDSIPFDAKTNDSIYTELLGDKQFDKEMYEDTNKALEKVCKDRRLNHKVNQISHLIDMNTDLSRRYISDSKLELHLVAICYNKDKEILIVQRNSRKALANKWEFGCAKANYKMTLEESITREYKEDFGIDIEVLTDKSRKDCQPIPLAVYTMEKNEELHKGIIFLAKIKHGEVKINPEKHQNYKFIKETELNIFSEDDFVNDALDSIKKAFLKIREIEQ